MMRANTIVTLTGIRKGVITPVAIILLPAGSAWIIGAASRSKICAAHGIMHKKMMSTAADDLTTRLRNSIRCEMKVSSLPDVFCSSAMELSKELEGKNEKGVHGN